MNSQDETTTSPIPEPLPAEGVWVEGASDIPNWDAMPRRNRRRRRRGSYPVWLKYLASIVGVAVLVTVAQIAYHSARSDPRDAQTFAERELRLSVLRPGERIITQVPVWQRPAIDYFRATKGLFVLTQAEGDSVHPVGGRLIYLGLQPRDPLSGADAPPTFDKRDWPIDSTVVVEPKRTLFYLSRGLHVGRPNEQLTVGVPSGSNASADALLAEVGRRLARVRTIGHQREEARRAHLRELALIEAQGKAVWYHTVRRGEALASIARTFGTTPEELRSLNGIEGNRIRSGETIIVKGRTDKSRPFPEDEKPEFEKPATATPPAP